MATLTHQPAGDTAERLVITDGARKIFFSFIIAGVVLLALGILAALMGWGVEHHEAAGHAAGAAHGGAHAEEGHSVLLAGLTQDSLYFLFFSLTATGLEISKHSSLIEIEGQLLQRILLPLVKVFPVSD